ncbi:MAG: hypothetical protein KUG78_18950 [Kangiellaceae bacterium]|nr:hypothetical protein [Kangiellaceae bacterium]
MGTGIRSNKKGVHPQGNKKSYGNVVHMELKDGRKVLGVERRDKDKIVFGFDFEGRLSSVGVYHRANSFGVISEWPNDEGVKISLSHISYGLSRDVIFTIEYQALKMPLKTKEELGF